MGTQPTAPNGRSSTLSEQASKQLLSEYGVPIAGERVVTTADAAALAAAEIGFPVVAKLNGERIAHKTERGLVRLRLTDAAAVHAAATDLLAAARPDDGDVTVLIAPMVSGNRELIAGVVRDPQFGPTVMLGVGGILAEAVADVVFRPAPLDALTAGEMIGDLATQLLLGEFRGEAAVDRSQLIDVLVGLGRLASERPDVASVDINPLIVEAGGALVAVDGLVELAPADDDRPTLRPRPTDEQFRALFEPRGVVVSGASTHPGKFGFVSLHNLLAGGYAGAVFGTNLKAEVVLGIRTVADIAELPDGEIDLVFVCTPASGNPALLRACAAKGIRAAFLTSAGYGEAGDDGQRAEDELVALADELGILLAGPNGQGVVSTPIDLCVQIVAPNPPAGGIGVASQSGNFVSSFLNLARATGVGISRAISAGNAAAVTVADYLDWYADDDATRVGLAYIEGVTDGKGLMERLTGAAARKPLVVVKGGATEGGAQAAASHTGALAANDKIFDGACRAGGITRAATVSEAFDAAATFATQPLPAGPNVMVLTTVGGWGVVTADAITRDRDLVLMDIPDDLQAAIDDLLPPRWSKNNPIDCAGGETRDTVPAVMALCADHPEVHSIIYLGLGIQSNQARLMREGRFYPDHGLERIVTYHERQDARFAQAAHDLSVASGKPILTATELAVADPTNAGPATVRATGRLCYASGEQAVTALGHLVRHQLHRQARGDVNDRYRFDDQAHSAELRRPRQPRQRSGGPGPWIILLGFALAPAIGLFALFIWADGAVDENEPAPPPPSTLVAPPPFGDPLVTEMLSLRRLPAVLSRDVNIAGFQESLLPFLALIDDRSCVAVSVDGVPVGVQHPDLAVIPASNEKLVVAAVALDVIGADTRYTTTVSAASAPVGGVVEGDLYLVGGGDPLLSSDWYPTSNLERYPVTSPTSLDTLADAVAATGITSIGGNIVGDGSRYDDEFFAPGWGVGVAGLEAGPYDALLANDSRVLGDELRAADPNEGAAREFRRLLTERGITVAGSATSGVAAPGAVSVATVESATMDDVVGEMLANSDNNTAELIVKEIGVRGEGVGTREAGLRVMTSKLAEWGISTGNIVLSDGSGLSLDNRLTCAAVLSVLQRFTPDSSFGRGLPVAGQTGTLASIFTDHPITGRLSGKTGTLTNPPFNADPPGVKALSGYVTVDGGSAIEYALILNGPTIADQSEYRPVWNALVDVLAGYPAGATPAELGPR